MHLHFGELLIAAIYLAAAVMVLAVIFGTHANKNRHTPVQRVQPPVKRIERKRDAKKDRKAA